MESSTTMLSIGNKQQRNIILFGDLTKAFENDFRTLLHCKSNPILQSFLDRVNMGLRNEFSLLPGEQQAWFPRFTDLIDLIANIDGTIGAPALKMGLFCVYQIGRFMLFDTYPEPDNTLFVSICAGSFAAAAISASRTMSELVSIGVQAALTAFRVGLHSLRVQRSIELPLKEGSHSWSINLSLTEPEAMQILDKSRIEMGLSESSQPYVSAVTPSSVVISGPPGILKRLIDSFDLKAFYIPIETPYHANHLNSAQDVDNVITHLQDKSLWERRPRLPVLSPANGKLIEAENLQCLLRQAVEDALCKQIRWDKILSELSSMLAQDELLKSCAIFPISSNAGNLLCSTLRREQHINVTLCNDMNDNIKNTYVSPAPGNFQDCKIAIVGYSGRFPEAASNEELWEVLKAARDCHRTIPEDRFDWEAHYDPSGKKKNHSRVKYGCFINEPGVFDARFFNLSPREAENTDPAQRLALMSAYEAIEMAGLVPDRTPSTQRDRVGVFMGVTSDDWREVNSGQDIDTYFIPGGNRAFVPGRISYFFRFSGPSISVDTACSSSFAAITTACNYLWKGDCDTAIAGGTNVLTNPDNFVGLDRGHFLSTTGNCDSFDNSASGYCRADAVGTVILKRLEDAQADHDPIFGVIVGGNTNHCGQTVSITRPHEGDQLSLFKRILRHSNISDTDKISYVEMHGTGTQAGDAAEMRSVLSAFTREDRRRSLPLYLGAIKANVGHSESASGVTALIKVLMMMKYSEIPPLRLNGELNHNYPADMTARNVHIPLKATAWRREDCLDGKRMAFLNNFSAAGGNTAVLLEDAPPSSNTTTALVDHRSVLPVTLSGKTSKALTNNTRALIDYLENHPSTSLSSLSYTTTARRSHHKFRSFVSGSDIGTIKSSLQRSIGEDVEPIKTVPLKVAFAFTGQGTLYAGIGKQLFSQVSVFRSDVLCYDGIAQRQGFPSILTLISGTNDVDMQDVDPIAAQLATVCVQMSLSHLWALWHGQPSSITGHSLGEYAALYASGILSASDVIYLVGSRAQLLSKYCTKNEHSMLAMKAPLASIDPTLESSGCTVACINSPTSTVASGSREAIERLSESLESKGIKTTTLEVSYGFHSAQVDPILAEFESLASTVQYRKPSIPYISPLLAQVVNEAGVINASYLTKATRDTVNFQGALEAAHDAKLVTDSTVWIEIGTHPACSGMIKQTLGSHITTLHSLRRDVDTWKVLSDTLGALYQAGADIQWNEFHRDFEAAHQVIALPSYKWDLKNYWIQYRHNFCLTKGDDPGLTTLPLVAPAASPFISSSVHRILEEVNSAETSTLLAESNLHDPRLKHIVAGHKVNTAMLGPSTLLSDMALTVVKHMLKSNGTFNEGISLDCGSMSIGRTLLVQPDVTSQLLRVSAMANWPKQEVYVNFFSVDANERRLPDHASCTVTIHQKQNWLEEWKRKAYLITSRISFLKSAIDSGNAHKLKRGLAYKLFSSLVDYSTDYQGMEQVILDSESLEATAEIKFQVDDQGFDWNPCWTDNLGHIAGFIMNGNDNVCSKDQVFINHGWESMRFGKPIEAGKTYTVHNRMELESGTMYVGNTHIFENEELIAIFAGVRFQGVKRSVLNHLLPNKSRPEPTTGRPSFNATAKQSKSTTARASATKLTTPSLGMKPTTNPPKTQPGNASRIVQIIAEEAQIRESEIDLNAEFTEIGIDSLLSLTIVSRINEELEVDVTSSSFFEYPTIKAFVNYTAGEDSTGSGSNNTGTSTPQQTSDESNQSSETDATSINGDSSTADVDIMAVIRKVMSEETGVAAEDIKLHSSLFELGLDSLLSLTISATLSELLDTDIPSSIFVTSGTLADIEVALCEANIIQKPNNEASSSKAPKNNNSTKRDAKSASESSQNNDVETSPHASSLLLSGSPKKAKETLFLFPDGAGSASSYYALPNISPDVVVYGLNCPWLKTPQNLKCSIEHYVEKFLLEVKRRQPSGPYNFGGMSAGGILAYEAAQQLSRRNERVARLLLIDSPNPIGLENPNDRLYDFLDTVGAFGMPGKETPTWLRPHFDAFLAILDEYEVQKFVGAAPPKTNIFYARDGMCKNEGDPRPELRPDDPREMRWLLNERTDFSGAGWNSLVGEENVQVAVLDDVNHFTIMQPGPRIKELSALMGRALCS